MGRRARIDQNKAAELPSQFNAIVPEQLLLDFNRACVADGEPRNVVVEAALRFYLANRKPPKRAVARLEQSLAAFGSRHAEGAEYVACVAALAETRRLAERLLEATKVVEPLLRVAARRR